MHSGRTFRRRNALLLLEDHRAAPPVTINVRLFDLTKRASTFRSDPSQNAQAQAVT